MTPKQFLERMREIYPEKILTLENIGEYGYNPEEAHEVADNLLCEALRSLGYGEGIEIFEKATKWYA